MIDVLGTELCVIALNVRRPQILALMSAPPAELID